MNVKLKIILVSLLILSSFLIGEDRAKAQSTKIVVIVNKENPIKELSGGATKLYYLRKVKKRWPAINKTIKPVDRSSMCKEKDAFLKSVLKMGADEAKQYFIERKISNAETPPIELDSDQKIIDYVSQNIGAIGYINASSLNSKVKVLYKAP